MTITISAVIPAKNEESGIVECIHNAKLVATEVVVVNDGSADRTAELARTEGARVVDFNKGQGSVEHLFKAGFEAASGQWLLRMDCDDRIPERLAEMMRAVAGEGKFSGVVMARKQYGFDGKWLRHGGMFKSDQMRFFRADAWSRDWGCEPHSALPVTGAILTLPATEELSITHIGHRSIEAYVRRVLGEYAYTDALMRYGKGQRVSRQALLLKPAKRFLRMYLRQRGFKDGTSGLVNAGFRAAYEFCVQAQLWHIGAGNEERA